MKHYLKQMDDGKWMEVITAPISENEEIIIDAIEHDTMPDMSNMELIYKKSEILN